MMNRITIRWVLSLSVLALTAAHQKQAGCQRPCPSCPEVAHCQDSVPLVLDGCRCCSMCARQHGQHCDAVNVCDVTKQLVCDVAGICRGSSFRSCLVNGTSYNDGQTFFTDCRTRCTCQDGSYACTSLCPQEMIRPSRRCRRPALAEVRGQCCRQWTCADEAPVSPAPCEPLTSDWSPCSATCGAGVSTRISNKNKACMLLKESRLCQIRECPRSGVVSWKETLYRMVREDDKVCYPTRRSPEFVHLHWRNCTSEHRQRPPFCTDCHRRCCRPAATFTRSLPFLCGDLDRSPSGGDHLWRLGEDAEPHLRHGARVERVTQKVMWIKNCVCPPCEEKRADTSDDGGDDGGDDEGREDTKRNGHSEEVKSQQLMGGDIDGDEPL